jgi:GNAT superfamily N-acetyltransferase
MRVRVDATAASLDAYHRRVNGLPAGLIVRPHTWDDLDTVAALYRESEAHDEGMELIDRDDIAGDWSMPSLDLEHDTLGVFAGTELAATAMLHNRQRAIASVRPRMRGQGIGSAVRRWSEQRARELGSDTVGQTVFDGCAAAIELLVSAGYTPRYAAWLMGRSVDDVPARTLLPHGVELRPMREGEERTVYDIVEGAFSGLPGRVPQTFEDFRATTLGRPDMEADDVLVALADGQLCGAACCFAVEDELWIGKLAVVESRRRRGIGRALLEQTFRSAQERGLARCGLATDSRNGARGWYEAAGMRVEREYTHFALALV